MRLTPAVASNRIRELENRLGVRLFNRTTRQIVPTEAGRQLYPRARRIVDAIDEAEAVAAGYSRRPKGTISITVPLGLGRRIIAPFVPQFNDLYPELNIRLRLSDRKVDMFAENVDVAFVLGTLKDSSMKRRKIIDCQRVLCAAPAYLEQYGTPDTVDDLTSGAQHCLPLGIPGSADHEWTLESGTGVRRIHPSSPLEADEGDVLTDWALDGRGIINKPWFEVAEHVQAGRLCPVLENNPPLPSLFACLYPHRRLQDPRIRLLIDFMIERCRKKIQALSGKGPGKESGAISGKGSSASRHAHPPDLPTELPAELPADN